MMNRNIDTTSLDVLERATVTLVGDGVVGKTSVLLAYATNQPPPKYAPTIFDTICVNVNVDKQIIQATLQDTAGQSDYDMLRPLAYPSTDVFIVCFSMGSEVSQEWGTNTFLC